MYFATFNILKNLKILMPELWSWSSNEFSQELPEAIILDNEF